MKPTDRQALLIVVAICGVGLLLLDAVVIEPAFRSWQAQSERIGDLQKKVDRGEQLLASEHQTRARWAEMQRANLPADDGVAESKAYRAILRWQTDSGIAMTSFTPTPNWQPHDDDSETYECRAVATGNQATLGRFIYDLETDPIPVSLEECEISTRDSHGSQLTMTARFSFMRLGAVASNSR